MLRFSFLLLLFSSFTLSSCVSKTDPQTFDELLKITDTMQTPICTIPLAAVRKNLSKTDLESQSAMAFDLDTVARKLEDDPSLQISTVFRRGALKRRLNVNSDGTDAAKKYYKELDDGIPNPNSFLQHHDKLHFWADRFSEQIQNKDQKTDDYNLRFCVINEARAKVHSASRAFILSKLSEGSLRPDSEVLENINHEIYYGEEFKKMVIGRLFTKETLSGFTALEMALLRRDMSILPSDPKISAVFWDERDKEIEAVLSYISSHNYETPALKLAEMSMIDQSMRKLWSRSNSKTHFESEAEHEAFKSGISSRVMRIDEFNTSQLKRMLKGRGWFRDDKDGNNAGRYAWLIAQHADQDPAFQQQALKLIEAELDSPGVSKSNYAYLYDRVQMRFNDIEFITERKQRYGTQGRCTGPGTWEPLPMEDPENVDDRRAEVGLGSMEDYKARFKTICSKDER